MRTKWYRAFSLIELLVAISVAALLCLLLFSITTNTQGVARLTALRLDANSTARLAFACMTSDIEKMVGRRDLAFSVPNGSPLFAMIANVRSSSGDRGLSVVYYRVANDQHSGAIIKSGHLTLQRATKGISTSNAGFMGVDANDLTVQFSDLPAALRPSDSDYDVLADGIIALNVSLQRRSDGRVVSAPPTVANGTALSTGDPDLSKISALVITAVVIGAENFKQVSSAQVDTIAAKFEPPAEADLLNGKLAAESWQTLVGKTSEFPGIPTAVIRSLRIYQRFIPLPSPVN